MEAGHISNGKVQHGRDRCYLYAFGGGSVLRDDIITSPNEKVMGKLLYR